jgi:hypothetical protein
LKESIVRPGKAALDYIGGKRIRYYNAFYLCLILAGAAIVLSHMLEGAGMKGGNSESQDFIDFVKNNVKFILLGIVPLLASTSKLVFRKLKLNFAEHLVIGGFSLTGILTMNVICFFLGVIQNVGFAGRVFDILITTFIIFTFAFPIWSYANLAWRKYTLPGLVWRVAVFYILLIVEALFLLMTSILLITGNSGLEIN